MEEGLDGGPGPCQGGPGRLHPHRPPHPQLLSCPRGPDPRGEATSIYSPFVPPPVAFLWDLLSPPAPMAGSPETPACPLQTWVTGSGLSPAPMASLFRGRLGPWVDGPGFLGCLRKQGWWAARVCACWLAVGALFGTGGPACGRCAIQPCQPQFPPRCSLPWPRLGGCAPPTPGRDAPALQSPRWLRVWVRRGLEAGKAPAVCTGSWAPRQKDRI